MKYYTSTTEFNCGIDLHARQMYVCVMDRQGKKLVHTNIKNNDFAYFLQRIQPYKHDLTVCAECMFGWWLLAWRMPARKQASLSCWLTRSISKAIHGGKNKNDRIDSRKDRPSTPQQSHPAHAYVYPSALRAAACVAPPTGFSTFGGAPIYWLVSIPINWPTTARPCARVVPIAIPGKKNFSPPRNNLSASWPCRTI